MAGAGGGLAYKLAGEPLYMNQRRIRVFGALRLPADIFVGVVASSKNSQQSNTTEHSITVPACEAGDLVLVSVLIGYGASAAATPAGMTLVTSTVVSTDWRFALYKRIAPSAEVATAYDFASTGAAKGNQHCVVIRGANTASALDVSTTSSDATTTTFAGGDITSAYDPRIVLWFAQMQFAIGTRTSYLTSPAGITDIETTADTPQTIIGTVSISDTGALTSPGSWTIDSSETIRANVFGVSVDMS